MSERTAARRYAQALFDVTKPREAVDAAERELAAFTELLNGHAELRRVLETPTVPPQNKRAIVDALIDRTGEMQDAVRRLLRMLANRDRLSLLPEISAAFGERVRLDRNAINAEIITATPLPDAQRASLTSALQRASGADVTLKETIDPSIIGGVVARVGSLVFDGSVTRQLERMRRRLQEER